jgi:hypothetical protein
MFERSTAKLLPLANRAAEVAPMTTACCNACRTCATTNLVGIVFAAGAFVAAPFVRLARRIARS